ncbi:DUF397 domain-containing protein [Actinomadura viridis]|uniref:DUF397 domain-containing protein n=1 Tax=Actinomadura viridis TaxID=58110 RepID=UPI00367B84D2
MDVTRWRKAQSSGSQGDACVEVARFPGVVGVRDSKDPDGPRLALEPDAFGVLLARLKQQ